MKKVRVAVLGATGMAGQEYVRMLSEHPYFEIACVTGKSSVGKRYSQSVKVHGLPKRISEMIIRPTQLSSIKDCDLVFSPLPTDAAFELEPKIAKMGFVVISDSSCHRMERDIPLIIPDVNPDHLELLKHQKHSRRWDGSLVTTPNCTAVGLATVLKPVLDQFGLRKVVLTTMQALSGAGYPGVSSLDIVDNVIPFINEEEEKVRSETLKILGRLRQNRINQASFNVEASCNRVQTIDGHLESVYLETEDTPSEDEFESALSQYTSLPQRLRLPTAPERPIVVTTDRDRPQPRLDRNAGSVKGMSVVVGRIRRGFTQGSFLLTLLCHNRIRGASGSAILLGELMWSQGYVEG